MLKRGVLMALQDWRARAHGYEAVADLARAVALVRLSSAVGVLGAIVEREFEKDRCETQSRALSAIIAALHGFAPAVDVERVVQRAFYHPRCDPHLAAQLFLCLVRCQPDAYPLHCARFLELRESVPSRFMHIGRALIRAIGPPVLIDKFSLLPPDQQSGLIELLTPIKNSPIEITIAKQGLRLVWVAQPKWQFIAQTNPASPTEVYAEQFQRIRAALRPGIDINACVRGMTGVYGE